MPVSLLTVTSAFAALGLGATLGAPALAAATRAGYDALGDSYASGYGAPPYSDCGRSQDGYPGLLDGRMRIALDHVAACAGARTGDVVATQLDVLDAGTDLVTLSVGGNDIGWAQTVGACVLGDDSQCSGALSLTTTRIQSQLPGLLDQTYTAVAEAAPEAHVVVTGYPRLFSPEHGAYRNASPAEQQTMNEGADLINAVTAEAADRHGFQFVDVTDRFTGHGVNAPAPWILGIEDPALFHPNAAGYRAYAAALTAQVSPRDLR